MSSLGRDRRQTEKCVIKTTNTVFVFPKNLGVGAIFSIFFIKIELKAKKFYTIFVKCNIVVNLLVP
jgi:hypothetical protein